MADNSNGTNSSVIKAPEYKELASVTEGRTITGDSTRAESIRSFGYQEETGSGAGDWFGNLLTTDYFWNNNREPAPSFNFFLRIEAVFDAPCRSVRAFTKENEFEEIQEGGRNDYVILKRKPISRRFTLQVERYVGIDKVDPLQLGTEMVLPMILAVSRVSSSSSGFAETLSETEFIRFYAFTGCIVTGKEYGELNAEQSGLLREVTTIAYREMIALTTPNADMTKKPWNIVDWDANRTDPNARANDPFPAWNEARAEKRTWLIGSHQENKDKTENDMRSAARPKSDSNRAKAKMWGGFDGSSHDKTKNKSATQNEYDGTTATVKLWKMPAEGEEASAKALRSATVNDRNDKARAVKKAWKVKKGKIDAKGRSATVPESDTRKATVKSWNIDPKKTRQSKAVKPTDDKKRANAVSFTIKNPEKNAFAVKPPADGQKAAVSNMFDGNKKATVNSQNDTARAKLKAWKIKKGKIDVASRIAAVPENDGSKATVKSWNMDPKLSRQQSAGKPTGDEKRAGA
ncbi:MAG: hypothetical protein K6E56_06340, partial [Lachnospiraceae bacterium]|nr:hypothetical protein [Lachnospiraceae bacterium]